MKVSKCRRCQLIDTKAPITPMAMAKVFARSSKATNSSPRCGTDGTMKKTAQEPSSSDRIKARRVTSNLGNSVR